MPKYRTCCLTLATLLLALLATVVYAEGDDRFQADVAPILERRCLSCHGAEQSHGGLSLATQTSMLTGGESGEVVLPGDPDSSYLLEMITPHGGKAAMPKNADPLSAEEIATIRAWIEAGANWPEGVTLSVAQVTDTDWWSLRPLHAIEPPMVTGQIRTLAEGKVTVEPLRGEHPIDRFVAEKHQELGLSFGPLADRRTLVRRLYFDLIGLPPTPDEMDQFVNDVDPAAYEKLVDTLLASPQYGERWARHWLDVVHYGDTHGYDKDKPRPHAWPYRDYVIRSLNQGKPWSRFIEEQLAGDVLYPGTADGVEALGFIAAGPWDYVGHAEVAESKTDGKIARHLDRDDMVRNAIQSFNALTIGCAQCHNHKFDPISQEQYYQLHAVFAAVDRADKEYFREPESAERYATLTEQQETFITHRDELRSQVELRAGGRLSELDKQIGELRRQQPGNSDARYGYHSAIEARDDVPKWVQIDLGSRVSPEEIVVRPAYDDFNGIGAGFGFPQRFRIEISDDPQFLKGVHLVADHQADDLPNPGTTPQRYPVADLTGRYVRLTATKLAPRQNDFILALAELEVIVGQDNWARQGQVASLDSIEAPPRWGRANLIDAVHPATPEGDSLALQTERDQLWQQATSPEIREQWAALARDLKEVESALAALPKPERVYAATVHHGSGTFVGRGGVDGEPRPIHLLHRGEVNSPGKLVEPAALEIFAGHPGRFDLPEGHTEGQRRAALAKWLSSQDNPLTWRTIANRVWQYHFGQGLTETPGDLGRQGAEPTHPALLDYLAVELRDGDQSLKHLHRLIVTSHTYRQASTLDDPAEPTTAKGLETDVNNRWLWRANRRKLEAEAVRDAVLAVSGKLDRTMGGPAFQDFVIEKPEHSPHYQYHLHDPLDMKSHRRSVYRFIVRSQLQPFMNSLNCADPSQQVDTRGESVTPLQALAVMNNALVVAMSREFAARLEAELDDLETQISLAFRLALGREVTDQERQPLMEYASQHGLPNFCRLVLNLNEFHFVD